MQAATATILIHRPVRDVFNYIDDPQLIVEWLPNMVQVADVRGAGLGQEHTWAYQMGGMLFRGECVVIDYVPDRRRIVQSIGGIQSTWTFEMERTDGATKLLIEAECIIPLPFIGRLAEKVVRRRNEDELVLAIENIKDACERERSSGVRELAWASSY